MKSQLSLSVLFLMVCIGMYWFFNYQKLQSTFVHEISNNSEIGVEGFEDRGSGAPELVDNLETLVNQIDDALLIKKYRSDYEKSVAKADQLFELLKIDTMMKLKDIDMEDKEGVRKVAEEMSVYENAKESLEGILNYIDGK